MENIYKNGTAKKLFKFVAKSKYRLCKAFAEFKNAEFTGCFADEFDKLLGKFDLYMFVHNPNALETYETQNKNLTSYNVNCYGYAIFGITDENMPVFASKHTDLNLFTTKTSKIRLTDATVFRKSFLEDMAYYGIDVTDKITSAAKAYKNNSWIIAEYYKKGCFPDYHFARKTKSGKWYVKQGMEGVTETFYRLPSFNNPENRYDLIDVLQLTASKAPDQEILDIENFLDEFYEK